MIELKFRDNGTGISFDVDSVENDPLGLDLITGLVGGKMDLDIGRGTDFRIIFEQNKS